MPPPGRQRPAIFLDRDGTLNVEKGYLHEWRDWVWLPHVREGLASLKKAGYLLVVVSNQSGIARGYYDEAALQELNACINRDLSELGINIDAFYHCPHHPQISGPCDCRKPAPGMILRAARELGIDLGASWLFGDKIADIEAARASGVRAALLETGYGASQKKDCPKDAPVCENFADAVNLALGRGIRNKYRSPESNLSGK